MVGSSGVILCHFPSNLAVSASAFLRLLQILPHPTTHLTLLIRPREHRETEILISWIFALSRSACPRLYVRPPARESARDGAGGGGVPSFSPPPSPSRRRRAERSDAAVLLPVWQDDAAELRAQVAPLRRRAASQSDSGAGIAALTVVYCEESKEE